MTDQSLVLAVQDTCSLNSPSHPSTQDLGLIGAERDKQLGLFMHSNTGADRRECAAGAVDAGHMGA